MEITETGRTYTEQECRTEVQRQLRILEAVLGPVCMGSESEGYLADGTSEPTNLGWKMITGAQAVAEACAQRLYEVVGNTRGDVRLANEAHDYCAVAAAALAGIDARTLSQVRVRTGLLEGARPSIVLVGLVSQVERLLKCLDEPTVHPLKVEA